MNSKQILTSIDPIAVAARAALERNKEMLDRADSIALAPKRLPEITLPDPESVREVEYDPDSVAASILLGEGTGSLPADLAIGLTGGAAGPITEAVGGKSGVLDWIPGGSLAKAAVIALPKLARTVTHIGQRVAADDAVDLMREIAQTVVNRLARVNDHIVSQDEIKRAVFDEVSNLGNINGASLIRENATKMATDVLNKATTSILAGEMPDLTVKSPKTVAFSARALNEPAEVDPELLRAAKRQFTADMTAKFKELPEEIQQDISRRADEAADEAVRTAMETGDLKGNRDYAMLRASVAYRLRNSFTNKYLKELEQANQLPKEFVTPSSMMTDNLNVNEEINRAGREAGQAAYDEAIRNGLSIQDAKHAREIARDRARFAKRKELGGDAINNRRAALKANSANLRHAFDILSPELKDEIIKGAEGARDEAKKTVQEYGGANREVNKKGASAYHGYIEKATRKILQELGFKNANDPRLTHYSQLHRDGNHVPATPTEQVLMSLGTEPAATYSMTPTERVLMAADPAQVNYSASSAAGDALEDIADDEIDASVAKGWFNKEYLEKLRKEWGY